MHPCNFIATDWSPDFAYAIGLLATDGSLSIDGRHINFTSKDRSQVEAFRRCLGLQNKISLKANGSEKIKKYSYVQFGSVQFYRFLTDIGLTPAKSKTLGALLIPDDYYADFFRGCIDGDGYIQIAKHPESSRPQLRIRLVSASPRFLEWVQRSIDKFVNVNGGWIQKAARAEALTYAKADSIELLNYIYYPGVRTYLGRKKRIADPFLRMWPNW